MLKRKNRKFVVCIMSIIIFGIIIQSLAVNATESNKLEAPSNITIDKDYNVSWTTSEEADSYWLTFSLNEKWDYAGRTISNFT